MKSLVFWIVLYGMTYEISALISTRLFCAVSIVPLAMILYTLALLAWIKKAGVAKRIGLCTCKDKRLSACIMLLPMLSFPLCNILARGGFYVDTASLLMMLSISVVEEVFFRGLPLLVMGEKKSVFGILLSSILFSMLHLANLGYILHWQNVLIQLLAAFVAGICFGAVAVLYHSLIPSIAIHWLINITGNGMENNGKINPAYLAGIAVYAVYGGWLCLQVKMSRREITNDTLY